jgi:hypothetical protein
MIVCILVLLYGNYQKENWDFDDFPDLCKRKIKKMDEERAFANTPHFGGTPNNSQVWM